MPPALPFFTEEMPAPELAPIIESTTFSQEAIQPPANSCAAVDEERLRLGLLIMGAAVLIVIALSAVLSRRGPSLWGSMPVVGCAVGLALSVLGVASHEVLWDQIQFLNENVFFSVMVPPIVFASGFQLMGWRGEYFFKKLGTILWYALFGTLLSFALNFLVFWLPGLVFLATRLSVRQALTLSTILSATDLSAVQPLFRALPIAPLIQTITMGETMFNDGVAFSLYSVIVRGTPKASTPAMLCCWLVLDFLLSMLLGVFLAVALPTLIRRAMNGAAATTRSTGEESAAGEGVAELIVVQSMPWFAYLLGESLGLQGILVCMFAGIGTGRYTLQLFPGSDVALKNFFASTTLLAEACSFIFLGASLSMGNTILKPYFDAKEEISRADMLGWLKPLVSSVSAAQLLALHLFALVGVSAVRLASVGLTSFVVNQLMRRRVAPGSDPTYITPKQQLFIALCGARGAMAVALALRAQADLAAGSRGSAIVSAALTYTLFTTLISVLILPKLTRHLLSEPAHQRQKDLEANAAILSTTRDRPDAWDLFLRTLRHLDALLLSRIRVLAPKLDHHPL